MALLAAMAEAFTPVARLYVMPGCLACSVAKRDLIQLAPMWERVGIDTEIVTVSRGNTTVSVVPTSTLTTNVANIEFTGPNCCKKLDNWIKSK